MVDKSKSVNIFNISIMSVGIGDLLKELDIVEVISSYIDLRKSGNNYKASCPFHHDDTPSFFVSPQKGIWKCFGCGMGGDLIKFVSLYENISYTQAAVEIARKYGIKLTLKESSEENSKIIESLDFVSSLYSKNISKNAVALSYLRQRGIDSHTLKKFRIGFAENSQQIVNELKEAGLLVYYEKTGNLIKSDEFYRDMFRGRIVFPIRDEKGHVIAFGGRSLSGEIPKYINSPDSEVFKKSRILFGFYEGLNYIKELKRVIITEGYFDVISLFQKGIRYAVAPLGTSLTGDHAKLISRYAEEAILMFDGDEAGRKAVRVAVPMLLQEGINVKIFMLPEGEDADSYVRNIDIGEFKNKLDTIPDLFDELARLISEGSKSAFNDFLYYVAFLKDSIKAYNIMITVSKMTGIPVSNLSEQVYKKPAREKKERLYLSHAERIFLKGLMELKPVEIDLNSLMLSPEAMTIAESIIKEEYYEVPQDIINMKVYSLEHAFEYVVREYLKRSPHIEEIPDSFEERKKKLKSVAFAESNRFRRRF